jgi:hypothetical protein
MIKHGQWIIDYLDLSCIKMENDDQTIFACLTRDITKYFVSEGEQLSQHGDIFILRVAKK